MIAPFGVLNNWSNELTLLIAFIIGIGFGFAIERAGFGNAKKLAMLFYFKDFTVIKVMFTAVITNMAALIILSALGFLDLSSIFIPETYLWSGMVGGLIMGIGFVMAGFCPGTSFCSLATLKIDAAFYILGAAFGMFLFAEMVPSFMDFYIGENSGSMGVYTLYDMFGTSPGIVAGTIIIFAIGIFIFLEKLEKKSGKLVQPTED